MDLYKIECEEKDCETTFLAVTTGEEISAGIALSECPACGLLNLITNDTQFVAELKNEVSVPTQAEIKITADVYLDEETLKNAREHYGITDTESIANHLLSLKIAQATLPTVSWDGIIRGREVVKNIKLEGN